jgi:hypothetical protein
MRKAHKSLVKKPERDNLGDLGLDGRMILKCNENEYEGVYYIYLAQDKFHCGHL